MSGPLDRAVSAWDSFWFAPKPPHSLAIFRVLLGLFFLVYWLPRAPYVSFLFTPDGIFMPMYPAPDGGLLGARGFRSLIGALTVPPPPWLTWSLYSILVGSLVLFTVGWWTRASATVHFLLYGYFYHVEMYQLRSSYDRLFLQIALFMCFAHSAEVFSVKAWLRRRRGEPEVKLIPYWPARLICLQILLVYFGTGFHKTFAPSWHGGEILYYNFLGYWGSDLAFAITRMVPPMATYTAFVYTTIVFELAAPLGLYVRRLQPFYFFVGFVFHLSIAVTLQIWQFLAMPATYLLFVDPFAVARSCDRLTGRRQSS